jgi:hypothetical protein
MQVLPEVSLDKPMALYASNEGGENCETASDCQSMSAK